jgi:hypothetical protein
VTTDDRFTAIFGNKRGRLATRRDSGKGDREVKRATSRRRTTLSPLSRDRDARRALAAAASLAALRQCERELGRPPTVTAYERWRRRGVLENGQPMLAPTASVDRRLHETWKVAAERANCIAELTSSPTTSSAFYQGWAAFTILCIAFAYVYRIG